MAVSKTKHPRRVAPPPFSRRHWPLRSWRSAWPPARSRQGPRQRPAGAALRQPEIRPGQCARPVPTKDHDVAWVFTRAGLPVEITAEFENWRRIRDWEGAEGWVYHSLLSGKRTRGGDLKAKDDLVPLYDKPQAESAVIARLQSGVLGQVKRCNGNWCRIAGEGFDGWIPQERLWGVYPNEKVD